MGIHIASFRVILKRRESVIITSLANRERGLFPSWMAMVSFLEETVITSKFLSSVGIVDYSLAITWVECYSDHWPEFGAGVKMQLCLHILLCFYNMVLRLEVSLCECGQGKHLHTVIPIHNHCTSQHPKFNNLIMLSEESHLWRSCIMIMLKEN